MSCCDETTALVPDTDVSRRSMLKGAALVTSLIPVVGGKRAQAAEAKKVKLAFCGQLLCVVPYEITRAGGHFLNACGTNQGGGSPWVCTVPVQRDRFFATSAAGAIQPWNPGANSLYGVWALRVDAHHIVAGGDFTTVAGNHQARFAEFLR